jgi:hypothetical protein
VTAVTGAVVATCTAACHPGVIVTVTAGTHATASVNGDVGGTNGGTGATSADPVPAVVA